MEQEMYVFKHITEESKEQDVFKVQLKPKITRTGHKVKGLTIISTDDSLLLDFPQNAIVSVTISKPQQKLK
jgi:hypothetical protein